MGLDKLCQVYSLRYTDFHFHFENIQNIFFLREVVFMKQ